MPPTRAALLTLALITASAAHAQTIPTIHVNAHETVVDITVTDSKGNPVRGLKQSDFAIMEDGKPQSIRSFFESGTAASAPAQPPPKLPANVYTNARPASASGAENIILLDALNAPWLRARQAVIAYIKSMPPGTDVALMILTGAGIQVVHEFTSDPAVLLAALNNAPTAFLAANTRTTFDCVPEWLDQTTLKGLREVAAFVTGTKGKKNLLWFTVGMKRVTDPQFLPRCEIDPTPALHQTYALLSQAQVAVYSIDPRGLVVTADAAAGGPITVNSGTQAAAALTFAQRDNSGDLLSMESVAEATGGGAFYNTNDIRSALAKAIEDGSSFYTVSYSPPSAAYDGRYHTINVKLDRPGLHLVYRAGYYAEDPTLIVHPPDTLFGIKTRDTRPTGEAADPLTAAMSPLAPASTQILFNVRIQPSIAPPDPFDPPILGALNPKLKSQHLTRYELLYAVPASQISFTQAADGTYTGSLEFDVAAYDSDGRLVTLRSQTMNLPLTSDEYQQFMQKPFQFFQQLDLPPGQLVLRTGVKDAVSNKLGTLEVPITPAKNMPPPEAGQ